MWKCYFDFVNDSENNGIKLENKLFDLHKLNSYSYF